ncbi:uncharacterized protein LOC123318685 isoform X2 [Coccinella septempunctata]|uniref:uncharacterized protein LOC123318685 isoform X2 n=1 Tax=Coccinella septempunctata TaxID=41139 RepID=UPI001D06A296|nr:uncharacterized protein LOC123318685 isoform X2 [Coccinella septempunctata]
MHPNVKSIILLGLKSLITLITVTNIIAASPFCPRGEIRSAIMTLYPSNRPLRIENRKVIARRPHNEMNSLLFIKYESLNLLLYDPRAMHFICFNPKRTKLMPKRNPLKSKIDQCLFREEASREMPQTLRSYVNYHRDRRVMITIGQNGLFLDREGRNCTKKPNNHHHLHKTKRNCRGDSGFLISSCKDGKWIFCDVVKEVRKSRGVIHELKTKYCENT